MVSATEVIYILYETLWLWELLVFMFYLLWKNILQPMGKFKAIRLQYRGGDWFFGGIKWVPMRARKWAMRTGESHTVEMGATVITEGVHPWLFYDVKGTRPLKVTIEGIQHSIKNKTYNPDSEEFDAYATRQGFLQMLRANAIGNPGVILFIVLAGAGFAMGVLASPYILPAHTVYQQAVTTTRAGP